MKFKTKLYIGFGSVFILTLIFSSLMIAMMSNMERHLDYIVNDKYLKVNLVTQLKSQFSEASADINELFLIDRSPEKAMEVANRMEHLRTSASGIVGQLTKLVNRFEGLQLLEEYTVYGKEYSLALDDAVALIQTGQSEKAQGLYYDRLRSLEDQINRVLNDFIAFQEYLVEEAMEEATSQYSFAYRLTIGTVMTILLLTLGVMAWSIFSTGRSLRYITGIMGLVTTEKLEQWPRIHVDSKDEIGNIAAAFNHMAASLEQHAREQKEQQALLADQHWLKSQLADITAGYQGFEELEQLAKWFVSKVAPLIGASYGSFYVHREQHGLARLGEYAADEGNRLELDEVIPVGVGLVGQAAADQRTIILQAPEGEGVKIRTGFGEIEPAQLVIIPVLNEGRTVAVMEWASHRKFEEAEMVLLNELSTILGLSVHNIWNQMRIKQLLKDAQVFTEELQSQSEELQQQQEELRALNEQMGDQFNQTEKRNKELEDLKRELEYKNRQLTEASQYKTEFLANMSHELRTPLNSLLILSQMLHENKEGNLTGKQLEYARTIHRSGTDLLKLINEVLDLSKIESGKMELHSEDIKLADLLDSVLLPFETLASRKGLQINTVMDSELSQITLHTDVQKLEQVLKNLLSNAVKFTERGGVEIRLEMSSDSVLRFAVKDTGIGISPDKQRLIFHSFQQADGTTSRRFGGTGLGLSISKKLIELLGGDIEVESDGETGSTFTVRLPLKERLEARSSLAAFITIPYEKGLEQACSEVAVHLQELDEPAVHPQDPMSGRILLVDDDMRNIYALTSALEQHGMEVVFAENGMEGLQLLEQGPPFDLVLMDIMMPKLDGYETIRAIRENKAYAELPIIALTAKAMKGDREKCIQAGANDYISKPIQLDQLLSLVRVWLYR